MSRRRPIRALVLYGAIPGGQTLSYQVGWPRAFAADRRFETTLVEIGGRRGRLAAELVLRTRRSFDAVILLHSAFSNVSVVTQRLEAALRANPAPKAYFIGNEYKLMPEKMAFCEGAGVSLLVSMTGNGRVHDLYRARLGCSVACIPSGGVDPGVFFPARERRERGIDLGMRASDEPRYFGHQERRAIAGHFEEHAAEYGLRVDISFSPRDRFDRRAYADFLNRCVGQLGTEAGTDYFELGDALRNRVNAYVAEHPAATLEELRPLFFADLTPLPARMITGRQAEAAATKTVQVLFEGAYNGFFQPDVHYLALAKDFRNVADVVSRLEDEAYCRGIAENAYRVALEELTYERLLDRFVRALEPVLDRVAA